MKTLKQGLWLVDRTQSMQDKVATTHILNIKGSEEISKSL
jgi:hypothetical protein